MFFFLKKLSYINISDKKFSNLNFNEEYVAFFEQSSKILKRTFTKSITNTDDSKSLFKNYDIFVENNFAKKDGKTSNRINDLLFSFGEKNVCK